MKNPRFGLTLILLALLLSCIPSSIGLTQENKAPARDQSAAPTGTYAHFLQVFDLTKFDLTNRVRVFTLRLETNGTYFAESAHTVPTQDGDLVRLLPETARGTWRWDGQKQEFRLEPGNFVFYIKCLPVDNQHTNRLVWANSWLVREDDK